MSRTKKGAKGSGFEYWTARPGNRFGGTTGKKAKTRTHRVERQEGKKEALTALFDERCPVVPGFQQEL